jgi:hypothetical protein
MISTDDYDIMCIEKNLYQIEFKNTAYSLINSILKTRLLPGGFTDDKYKVLRFKAESVKTLKEYQKDYKMIYGKNTLMIPHTAKVIRSLSNQLNYLMTKELCTIIGYHPEEVIVINDENFVFLGNKMITKIDEDSHNIMLSYPYETSDIFLSPEILNIKEIPDYVHYKSTYFSLACLIIYLLIGNDDFYKEYLRNKDSKEILKYLDNHPIKETRIYWLLTGCLDEDIMKRRIILL